MANPVGLSYDQAPVFAVPLGFFLAAPVFLLLAGLLMSVAPAAWLPSRWMPASLALTHLITLGFLGMVMLGALFQMLPVLLNSPVPAANTVAQLGVASLSLGTVLLAWGLWQQTAWALSLGAAVLGLGLLPALFVLGIGAWRARSEPWLNWPIRLAWGALCITLVLGVLLAGQLAGVWPALDAFTLTRIHATWGLGGWITLLVVSVSFQLVPMLMLTRPYPVWARRGLVWALLAGLLGLSVQSLSTDAGFWMFVPSLAAALVFALQTLWLQATRRRKISDATLRFWQFGLIMLTLSLLTLPALPWLPEAFEVAWGIAFLLGFAVSVVNGMLYKIVPFLAWFHLQANTPRGARHVPNMKELLPEDLARQHGLLHVVAVGLLLMAGLAQAVVGELTPASASAQVLTDFTARLGGLFLAASAWLLARNLWRVWRMYRKHLS